MRIGLLLLLPLAAIAADLSELKQLSVILLDVTLHHVQGIEVDGDHLYVTSVDRQTKKGWLHLIDLKSRKLLREVEVQEGERYHPGGISMDADSLWIPVAEYRPLSRATVQQREKKTLRLLSRFEVPDHLGCVAATQFKIYGGNWDSRQIYEWDRDGKQVAKRDNPSGTKYQDMKFLRGQLVGSGNRDADSGAIDWLDPATLELKRRITAGKTDRGVRFNNEGMTIRGGKLYLLPEDGPSRLFVFELR